jgi:8-oxo-dGTP pyrophosphatase MutT (NUDIX family)
MRATPVARPAASVILLRDGQHGLEAWLMRRVVGMAFAGGMTVFPGGRVDASDADPHIGTVGGNVAALARRLGESVQDARAALVAAGRELFEETGVLLTKPMPAIETAGLRRQLEDRVVSFSEVLGEMGGVLDLDALHPWARWVTPESEPRRYDTHFYLAALPDGAEADDDTPEASAAHWLGIRAALAEAAAGTRLMLPPTLVMLRDLAGFDSVQEAVDSAPTRPLEAVQPVLEPGQDGLLARLPDGSTLPMPIPPG